MPTPCDAYDRPPGLRFASATSSATVLASTSLCTDSMTGNENSGVIGWKSAIGSYCVPPAIAGLTTWVA